LLKIVGRANDGNVMTLNPRPLSEVPK